MAALLPSLLMTVVALALLTGNIALQPSTTVVGWVVFESLFI